MTTQTAPNKAADRQLWQLPMFLLGVSTLVGVAFGRDLWHPAPAEVFRRDLTELRLAIDKAPPDLVRAEPLRRRIAESMDAFPDRLAEAHFLLGSADLVRAESLPTRDASADELWLSARENLEKAEQLGGFAEVQIKQIRYRLAKVLEYLDAAPPEDVILALASHVDFSVDPSEGHRRLAEAYLRLANPDYVQAADSLRKQLGRAKSHTPEHVLNEARLRLSEVLVKLDQPSEARDTLMRVTSKDPTIFTESRILVAQSYQSERDWPAAVRVLEQARDLAEVHQLPRVQYELGVCLAEMERIEEARQSWELAEESADELAGRAAALRLAEVRLREPDPEVPISLLAKFADGKKPNPLVSPSRVRSIYEEAIQEFRFAGDFDAAQQVAKLYGRVDQTGKADQLTAETAELWGMALEKQARTDPSKASSLETRATEQYRRAYQAYAKLAESTEDSVARLAWVRKANDARARAGGNDGPLEDELPIVPIPSMASGEIGPPNRPRNVAEVPGTVTAGSGDDWFSKGEAALAKGDRGTALAAFRKAISLGGTAAPKARYRLADVSIRSDDPDGLAEAIDLLKKNLTPQIKAQNTLIHELSMYRLGTALFITRQYAEAEATLREAVRDYPASDAVAQGWFQIAECCWYQASQAGAVANQIAAQLGEIPENQRADLEQRRYAQLRRYQELVQQRIAAYEEVENLLQPRREAGQLPADSLDEKLLRRASMRIAESLWLLRRYNEALPRCEKHAREYPKSIDELITLGLVYHISKRYINPPDPAKAVQATERMRQSFEVMKAEEDAAIEAARRAGKPAPKPKYFNGSTETHTRQKWENWFQELDAALIEP